MRSETIKRFLVEEFRTRISLFDFALFLIVCSPGWTLFTLTWELPQKDLLVEEAGTIQAIRLANPKFGGTTVTLSTDSDPIDFHVEFCRPFPASLTTGQHIRVWLDGNRQDAWQIQQDQHVICSFENAAFELASANRNLVLMMLAQVAVGSVLIVISYLSWRSSLLAIPATSTQASHRTRQKRRNS